MKKNQVIILVSVLAGLLVIAGTAFLLLHKKGGADNPGGTPTISVGTVSAKPGDTVKVPIKYTGNPGTAGVLFEIEYDAGALKYLAADRGDIIPDCEVSGGDGKLSLIAVANGDTDKDGTLAYLNFKVNEGASGETEIRINMDENAVCNYEEEVIKVTAQNGKIVIE